MTSINRSEEFVYFQHKARHYDNLKKMKAIVHDKLPQTYLKTISHSQNEKRRPDPIQEYDMQEGNESLINRLVHIAKSPRSEVKVNGNYSRYHAFRRSFREKNPYRSQEERTIQIVNRKMAVRLINSKPKIGTNSQWTQLYGAQLSHKRNLSRYVDQQRSKGQLHISTERFIPEHYKSFIAKDQTQYNHRKTITFSKQKLLELPHILQRENSESPSLRFPHEKSRNTLASHISKSHIGIGSKRELDRDEVDADIKE